MTSNERNSCMSAISRRAALGLIGSACLLSRAGAQQAMRLAHGYPPDSVAGRAAAHFAQLMAEQGLGAVDVFPNNSLMPTEAGFDLLRSNGIDAWMGSTPASNEMPSLRIFDVPFLIRGSDHLARAFDIGLGGPLNALFQQRGMTLVAPVATGMHVISSARRPVEAPRDLEGLRLGVRAGNLTAEGFARLGASVVQMPSTEFFPATRAGFLDAVAAPVSTVETLRLYETLGFLSLTRHVHGVAYLAVGRELTRRAGEARLRAIGREVAFRAIEDARATDEAQIASLARRGVKIVEVDAGRFEYTKKLTYDLYLNEAPEAWEILSLVEDAAY